MGIIRKTTSLSTLGVVRYRNPDERAAKVAKQTRNAARLTAAASVSQARTMRREARAARWVPDFPLAPQAPTQGPPPGWYPDAHDPSWQRWWDGARWTDHLQPRQG